jgi:hypothetical protein
MHEILQQENGMGGPRGFPGAGPAGNRNLSGWHLKTVRIHGKPSAGAPNEIEARRPKPIKVKR